MRQIGTLLLLLVVLSLAVSISAQELCAALVESALQSAAENCADVEGALGCYGNASLTATFQQESPDTAVFSEPGGTLALPLIHTVQTAGLDLDANEWGIAYFRVGASAEASVRIITLGDVFIENVIDATNTEPMQKLFIATGTESECHEAPNMVIIQGPENSPVDVVVNEVPIRIGSTIGLGLGTGDDGDVMWITVISGNATLYPDTADAVDIAAGQTTSVEVSPADGGEDNVVLDPVTGEPVLGANGEPVVRRVPAGDFAEPEFLAEGDDLPDFQTPAFYATLTDLPEALVNYTLTEIPSQETTSSGGGSTTCNLTTDPAARGIRGRTGPGFDRSVLRQLPGGSDFTPTNVENVGGQLWFEVTAEGGTVVWVEADNFSNVPDCGGFVEAILGEPIPTPLPPDVADPDLDGIPDATDGCPRVAGPASNNGCPNQS
jgi:hypothetical protein